MKKIAAKLTLALFAGAVMLPLAGCPHRHHHDGPPPPPPHHDDHDHDHPGPGF